ncbi:D-mannonate oxidoreductase, NAD-binding [uncultured Pleomorphomonas sp.]|uniref:D-mannonate oxidoreductase, NAD-binding n=1 Tax=uncultured Pleomorphomonas sp. TaxID=442121 RepID=A0A212LIC5_9HYPH|nr:mannitol dehydrogenase family protein [uncultured Pleomorphomonas sp.]SCM77293.1 D-mannonate oxidoreductase, NAD-binding [uncultured Pleomorphomonas sp.]
MIKLNNANLATLPADVARPTYDRSRITTGIVHFGVGGFHRAHQAMYLDRLMNKGEALDWGICGVGVMPSDQRMRDALNSQDGLYTLMVKHPDGHYEASVIGSIVDFLYAPDDPEAVLELMAAPSTRIVSLTITEGGYNFHHVTGEFDLGNADVVHDLAAGAVPRTVFGLVTEALRRRRARSIAPFTVMSCDNIQSNGDVARKMFCAYAGAKDAELGDFIASHVAFPNAMVDRITPVTTREDVAEVARRFGIDDAWPVVCEPFTQWVVEDHFPLGRPAYEKVGVQMVADVVPYELMKLRLLNASHQALTYFGYLAGYRYAHEVTGNPLFAKFLLDYMTLEGTPTLSPVPGVDLDDYRRTLIERFSNPEVRDTLARLCAESSDRIPKWLLPVIRCQLKAGGDISRSAAVVASWARYAEGTDEQGRPIEVVDRLKDRLMAIAAHNRDNPTAFIENRELFGDLADEPRFVAAYREALASLHSAGALETVRRYC